MINQDVYELCKTTLIQEQSVSIALLRQHLNDDDYLASGMMEELEKNEVVTTKNRAGFRTLSPNYMRPLSNLPVMDAREKYMRAIVETALFFRDILEEKNDGRTTAIQLLKPVPTVGNVVMRKFVLHALYRKQGLGLTEVTLRLAAWLADTTVNSLVVSQ